MNHICTFFRAANRFFRNISFCVSQCQIVACIQHSTVSISSSLYQIFFLRCSNNDCRSIKSLHKHCLCNLWSKISKIHTQSITSCLFKIVQCLQHMNLTLHNANWTFINIFLSVFILIRSYQIFSSVYG